MSLREEVLLAMAALLFAVQQSLNSQDCFMDLPGVPVDASGLPVSPAQSDDTAGSMFGGVETLILAAAAGAVAIYNANVAENGDEINTNSTSPPTSRALG